MTETEIEGVATTAGVVTEVKPPNHYSKYNTEFRVIESTMTIPEVTASHKPGLRELKCVFMGVIGSEREGKFLRGKTKSPMNVVPLGEATVHTVGDIIEVRNEVSCNWWQIAILNPEAMAKAPPERHFVFEQTINATIIELAKVAPLNPTLRSHLAAIFGKAPPAEVDTYDKIKDWAEFGFEEPSLSESSGYGAGNHPAPPSQLERPQTRTGAAVPIRVPIERTFIESGRCRYNVNVTEGGELEININDLASLINPEDDTMDEMMDAIRDHILDNASECTGDGDYGDYEYEDLDSTGTDNEETNWSVNSVRQQLEQHIRNTYGTEQGEEIINR